MNIHARIVARKIVLTYFYEKMISDYLVQSEMLMGDIDAIKLNRSILAEKEVDEMPGTKERLENNFPKESFDDDITYIARNSFEKHLEGGIDFEYINAVGKSYDQFADKIGPLVNQFTTTFKYEDMDLIDRVIFLLGYTEYSTIHTPKEVVMNEMVELAKKYGDEGTPKLVNGILHKVIAQIDENDPKKEAKKEEKKVVEKRKAQKPKENTEEKSE